MFNENNIVDTIKKRRIQNPVRKRPLGRPKLRWEDTV